MGADIKGVGVRELFKRLEEEDLESYEMLHSGFKLKENDYISQIRVFTRKNTPYNNILRKYLAIQKNILKTVKEGDFISLNAPETRSLLRSTKGLTAEQVKMVEEIMKQMRKGNTVDDS